VSAHYSITNTIRYHVAACNHEKQYIALHYHITVIVALFQILSKIVFRNDFVISSRLTPKQSDVYRTRNAKTTNSTL